MKKCFKFILAVSLAVVLLTAVVFLIRTKKDSEYSMRIFAMNTTMELRAYGEKAEEAVKAGAKELNRLDALWNVNKENSEISVLNREGSLSVSKDTFAIIERALEISKSTEDKFDISIYPVLLEWGFTAETYSVPSESRLKELLRNVDYSKISLDYQTNTVTLKDGMQIVLGGIAKGYAGQRMMEIFEEYDVSSGLVSLGGNVQAYGKKPDGSLYRIGIRNPDTELKALSNQEYIGELEITDKAAVTSGGYERYFISDGEKYHHIIDPETGKPADNGLISVTIISADGTLADGLSTSLYVMGLDDSVAYWKSHSSEFDFVLVDNSGNIYVSDGLTDCFSSADEYSIIKAE